MNKQQDVREWLNFDKDVQVTLTLESDPKSVVPKKKTGDYGDYVVYYHKAVGAKMFSATEILQRMLVDYTVGDKITVTKVDNGGRVGWKVEGNRPEAAASDVMTGQLASRVNSIEAKLDQVLKHIYGDTEKAKIPESGETKDASELGF